jgi:hypothetical protein
VGGSEGRVPAAGRDFYDGGGKVAATEAQLTEAISPAVLYSLDPWPKLIYSLALR